MKSLCKENHEKRTPERKLKNEELSLKYKKENENIEKVSLEELTINDSDLKGYSLDEILTEQYGEKGTKERVEAEERVNDISKNLVENNNLKEAAEGKIIPLTGKHPDQDLSHL